MRSFVLNMCSLFTTTRYVFQSCTWYAFLNVLNMCSLLNTGYVFSVLDMCSFVLDMRSFVLNMCSFVFNSLIYWICVPLYSIYVPCLIVDLCSLYWIFVPLYLICVPCLIPDMCLFVLDMCSLLSTGYVLICTLYVFLT